MTNSIVEVEEADLFFIIGTNTTSQHPLIGSRIINAKERGAKIVLADPAKYSLPIMPIFISDIISAPMWRFSTA